MAVLPEAEDVDVHVDPNDLQIDVYRSSGPGGQSVNTTDSAVRITHKPTGIVVSCQNERSQHRNRDSAKRVLKARLFDIRVKEQQSKLDQIGGEKRDIAFVNSEGEVEPVYTPLDLPAGVVLAEIEDLEHAEIAEVLGTSASTVAVHLHRGRNRLRDLLGEDDG